MAFWNKEEQKKKHTSWNRDAWKNDGKKEGKADHQRIRIGPEEYQYKEN